MSEPPPELVEVLGQRPLVEVRCDRCGQWLARVFTTRGGLYCYARDSRGSVDPTPQEKRDRRLRLGYRAKMPFGGQARATRLDGFDGELGGWCARDERRVTFAARQVRDAVSRNRRVIRV